MIGPGGETGVTSGNTDEGMGEAEMKAEEVEQNGPCQGSGDGGSIEGRGR